LIGPYDTPLAFRAALKDRLRTIALNRGTDLQRLQRRVAFERLLARLFAQDDPPWLLKGGCALELRLEDRARTTLDLDLAVPDPACLQLLTMVGEGVSCVQAVYELLQQAAEQDLDDGFEFLIGQLKEAQTGAPRGGGRCPVDARLAGQTFVQFHLDIGLGDAVLDQSDWVEGSGLLAFAGIPAARIALYPITQQFAEKVHAYSLPRQDRENTRVKDLVDLVLLIHIGQLESERVKQALRATFETRNTHPLPTSLPEPPQTWAESYAALAQDLGLPTKTLQEAHVYLDTFWQKWELGRLDES
jgi:hypothetical protein